MWNWGALTIYSLPFFNSGTFYTKYKTHLVYLFVENLGGPKFEIGTYYCKGAISPMVDGSSWGKVELSSARSS